MFLSSDSMIPYDLGGMYFLCSVISHLFSLLRWGCFLSKEIRDFRSGYRQSHKPVGGQYFNEERG